MHLGLPDSRVAAVRPALEADVAPLHRPGAVVLWRRVKARAPDDPRAAQLIAKCLSDLGDLEGAT